MCVHKSHTAHMESGDNYVALTLSFHLQMDSRDPVQVVRLWKPALYQLSHFTLPIVLFIKRFVSYTCLSIYMWGSVYNSVLQLSVAVVSSIYHVDPGDQIQTTGFEGNHLYLLSHLTGPICIKN